MKVNFLINEIAKGQWAMSGETLGFWFSQAERILKGEKLEFEPSAKSLIDYYDQNNNRLSPDRDGVVNVPKGSIAVINLIGPIITYGDYCSYGADEIVGILKKLDADSNIKGILIYVDGPGGSVSAIPGFVDFGTTRNKTKPLGIVYEMMCSAHLYLAYGLQPDFVWASNDITACAGSIGIVLTYMDNREYLKNNGFKMEQVYPEESEDKNYPERELAEGNSEPIKKLVLSPLAKKFQTDAVRLRPQLKSEVKGVITGSVYFTSDALKYGFADGIGNVDKAIQELQVMSELRALNRNY